MCGRYGLISNIDEIAKEFDTERIEIDFKPDYNIPPSLELPVIERHSPNSIHFRKWGVMLYDKYFTINARTDKLESNPIWRNAIQTQRCIIPADFFYEWKRENSSKQPYLFKLKKGGIMGFAGFLIEFKDKSNENQIGFIMLTTEANSLMAQIHDRLPCILRKEDQDEWLNPDNVELEQFEKFLKPFPSAEMEMFPVSTDVNSVKNNSIELIKPLGE